MTEYKEKLICPSCESKDVVFKKERGYCFNCKKNFFKAEAKIIRVEVGNTLPPTLQRILKAKGREVVNINACPFCGSSQISRNHKGLYTVGAAAKT